MVGPWMLVMLFSSATRSRILFNFGKQDFMSGPISHKACTELIKCELNPKLRIDNIYIIFTTLKHRLAEEELFECRFYFNFDEEYPINDIELSDYYQSFLKSVSSPNVSTTQVYNGYPSTVTLNGNLTKYWV